MAYGFPTPEPKRDWYRRLRRGDTSVFREELERWGDEVQVPRIGSVALCQAENGYGLAVYWQDGWLSFAGSEVTWSPTEHLQGAVFYCQRKQTFAML